MTKAAVKESTRKRILDDARQEIVIGKGDLEVANVAKRAGSGPLLRHGSLEDNGADI
ncbi:hypothetical protein QTP81_00305 [Alteromonas sp. ASW11-36]|uniref:TetR family transcriptional regulator n=1 Tax=Alteromonas arenosi TaxID=3055817 RepID=A0ABT7SS75_9ALTE|nr:hypothetical protein [Alteromonas sp. ASW11-36]MDM7859042.1 hypothetical protein [Alteromonas sp. ASW11-36]